MRRIAMARRVRPLGDKMVASSAQGGSPRDLRSFAELALAGVEFEFAEFEDHGSSLQRPLHTQLLYQFQIENKEYLKVDAPRL